MSNRFVFKRTYKDRISVPVDEPTAAQLARIAKEKGTTMSVVGETLIGVGLEEYLKEEDKAK